ncbi:DUF4232 domain-containing protein [Paraburkholderia pallida]|uniref:DUF4232 domain-containing protein n=1 Tax=Paraburkholderia pallida TaxID=2547399 RepID=A0A4P7D558_9BURK|nr:DUF4232 domain-containing protein [Paraburkholderia pallida]QBR01905.1 DUF4232 domain-containing protein [Paraburkholderia pallida]
MSASDTKRISTACIGTLLLAMVCACTTSASADVAPCTPGQLELSLDDGGGAFTGMSHGGTWVVLRNLGASACRVPARPDVTFLDAHDEALRASLQPIRGMNPGPVLLPVEIPAQARVRASLRWVTGEVFDDTQCIDAAFVRIGIGEGSLTTPFHGHLCGSRAEGPLYQMVPFQPLQATQPD